MSAIVCDRCRSRPATALDWDGLAWCPRCWWDVAAARAGRAGLLAPVVLDIRFLRAIADGPARALIPVAAARRLGLPAEEGTG